MNTKKYAKGFTLVELIVVIAIIGILAAVVFVSMQSFGARARASRALAQASSVIPSMVSCAGNGGTVSFTGQICDLSADYGSWPTWPTSDYGISASDWTSLGNWYFKVKAETGVTAICCNSTMNGCGQPASCDVNATW